VTDLDARLVALDDQLAQQFPTTPRSSARAY
jgi:hypothetical protein